MTVQAFFLSDENSQVGLDQIIYVTSLDRIWSDIRHIEIFMQNGLIHDNNNDNNFLQCPVLC